MYQRLGNTEIPLYDLLGLLSFVPVLIFNFCQFNKKKMLLSKVSKAILHRKKSVANTARLENILVFLEICIISTFQYGLTPNINFAFGAFFGTGANYFGLLYINPILVAFVCCILGINFFKQLDLVTPAFPLALIIIKFACFCQGCCEGVQWEFGLYNHDTGLVEIPVQLLEAALALLIFFFLMFYKKKAKEGTIFPVYFIIYSATRFFSEFLRADPDVIWKLKAYHLFCLSGVVVGLLELFVIKYASKITVYFNRGVAFISQKISQFVSKNRRTKKNIVHHKKRKKK